MCLGFSGRCFGDCYLWVSPFLQAHLGSLCSAPGPGHHCHGAWFRALQWEERREAGGQL